MVRDEEDEIGLKVTRIWNQRLVERKESNQSLIEGGEQGVKKIDGNREEKKTQRVLNL